MKTKRMFKLGFTLALVTVLAVAGATVLTAQPTINKVTTDCPASTCPSNLSGYNHTGSCTFNYGHGCVLECDTWSNGSSSCHNNCNWQ